MTHHEKKKEEKEAEVEPIKPGDPRVARKKGSLLDTSIRHRAELPRSKLLT
jgi:hypothetical protein